MVDGFLGAEWCRALRAEVQFLVDHGLMKPNETQFGGKRFTKPHIFECDMHDEEIRSNLPELSLMFHQSDLRKALAAHLPDLDLCYGDCGHVLKLQHNTGQGGCFPCHFDNPGRPNKRRLTCLYYMNVGWTSGDGGEIVLIPFLEDQLTIPPLADRLLIFRSDTMLHLVKPSLRERFALTWWLDGEGTNTSDDLQLRLTQSDMADLRSWAKSLRNDPVQRLLSRAVYDEEYEASLVACMQGSDGCGEMVAGHRAQVERQRAHPSLKLLIDALRLIKNKS